MEALRRHAELYAAFSIHMHSLVRMPLFSVPLVLWAGRYQFVTVVGFKGTPTSTNSYINNVYFPRRKLKLERLAVLQQSFLMFSRPEARVYAVLRVWSWA